MREVNAHNGRADVLEAVKERWHIHGCRVRRLRVDVLRCRGRHGARLKEEFDGRAPGLPSVRLLTADGGGAHMASREAENNRGAFVRQLLHRFGCVAGATVRRRMGLIPFAAPIAVKSRYEWVGCPISVLQQRRLPRWCRLRGMQWWRWRCHRRRQRRHNVNENDEQFLNTSP